MSRPLRIEFSDAWYHVMNRGRRGETLFRKAADYHYFIKLLKDTVEMWHLRIAAYSLMTNHYHLLVQTPQANLSRCMRHINGVYTQYYNRTYLGDGQLFRGRYKSILIDADTYLLELVKYIHRNPVRAGIADTVGAYDWSSHKGYVSHAEKWDWLYTEFVLSMLTRSKQKQKRAYVDLIDEEESASIIELFSRRTMPAILGGETFIERIRKKYSKQRGAGNVPQRKILALPIDVIKGVVAKEYGTSLDALALSRRGVINEPRAVAIYLAKKYCGKTLPEIGLEFNLKQYSSVGSMVSKMAEAVASNRKIKTRVQKIEKILNKS